MKAHKKVYRWVPEGEEREGWEPVPKHRYEELIGEVGRRYVAYWGMKLMRRPTTEEDIRHEAAADFWDGIRDEDLDNWETE